MLKKLIIAITISIGFATTVSAQATTGDFAIYQSVFGLEKKAIVKESISLTEEEAKLFWPIYDQYETERKEGGKQLFELIKKYTEEYETLTNEQVDALVKEGISLRAKRDKTVKKYYGKIKKATDAKIAAKFYQVENYIDTTVRLELLEVLPFVQEK